MPVARCLRKMAGGVSVVSAPAEFDITTAERLRAALLEATAGEHPVVVVDLTRTLFCGASGIHNLVRAHKRAVSQGGELRLVVPADGAVARIIHLTCLDHLMPCCSSLEQDAGPGARRGPARLGALAGLPVRAHSPV